MTRPILSCTALVTLAGFLTWVCMFQMVDADVWWHLKAGELLWQSGRMITIDPFAYTREGLPYLATHEWLFQILLYLIHRIGGPLGIVLLRIIGGMLMLGSVLLIDRRRVFPNALLCMLALTVMRQGLIERPQLLTNAFFGISLLCSLLLLEGRTHDRRIIGSMLALQVLWVNIHGAAALIAILPVGAVLVQLLLEGERRRVRTLALGICGLLLALFVSPNGLHTFSYLHLLLTDGTADLIREWAPHPWPQYLAQFGPFWAIALAAMITTRHRWIGPLLLLLATGMLSRLALRHEVLFLLTALAVTFHQLRHNVSWQRWITTLEDKPLFAIPVIVVVVLMISWIDAPYRAFVQREHLVGIGEFRRADAAATFVEEQHLTGPIFNTYAIGGELLWRFAPEKKIFIDGRNVDYGYDFLSRSLAARTDPAIFAELQKQYDFTVAIIEFASSKEGDQPFDFGYLHSDPQWALVFLDSWSAVYVRRTPEHQTLISEGTYRLLTPETLDRGTALAEMEHGNAAILQQELEHAVQQDARGISALLLLAKVERGRGQFDQAIAHAQEAARRAARRYEPYEILGSIYAYQERWTEAAASYDRVLSLIRHLNVEPNAAQLATVYERAGQTSKAERYRQRVRN